MLFFFPVSFWYKKKGLVATNHISTQILLNKNIKITNFALIIVTPSVIVVTYLYSRVAELSMKRSCQISYREGTRSQIKHAAS